MKKNFIFLAMFFSALCILYAGGVVEKVLGTAGNNAGSSDANTPQQQTETQANTAANQGTAAVNRTPGNAVIHFASHHPGSAGGYGTAAYMRDGVLINLAAGELHSGANAITIADNSVYIAGHYELDDSLDNERACYWKDSVRYDLEYGGYGYWGYGNTQALGITVARNSVYISGYSVEERPVRSLRKVITACYWKDGTKHLLYEGLGPSYGYGIAVLGDTVFTVGSHQSNDVDVACFWRNNTRTDLYRGESDVRAVTVSGNLVYMGGYAGHIGIPCYWTVNADGTVRGRTDLEIGINSLTARVYAITVAGNKVYSAGFYGGIQEKYYPCYWDGTKIIELDVPANTYYSRAEGIAVDGNNVYVTGFYDVLDGRNRISTSCYWLNGVRTDLPNPVSAIVIGSAAPWSTTVTVAPAIVQNSTAPVVQAANWPTTAEWTLRGLSTGLQQPAGTTVTSVEVQRNMFYVTLGGATRAAFNNLVTQIENKRGWQMFDKNSSSSQEDASFGTRDSESIYIEYNVRGNTIKIDLNNYAK